MGASIRCGWRALLPVAALWSALVTMTLWSVVESKAPGVARTLAPIAGLTVLKVILVIFFFMEVGRAPVWLKAACLAWIVAALGGTCLLVVLPDALP